MAKILTPLVNPSGPNPCVMVVHIYADPPEPWPSFHALALRQYYDPCLMDTNILVSYNPPPAAPPWDPIAGQLDLIQLLVRNPLLCSDMCSWCKTKGLHPHLPRWNLNAAAAYNWGIPSCVWDGNWPIVWTWDSWPPHDYDEE